MTRLKLDAHLKNTGLMFPIDPGADATIGGMAATRASGTTAVRYGTMRDNVLGLTVVLADGRIIRTGGRARKSSSGYDLTRLFVGSEGTLGVITELTLRLYGRPEAVRAAVCPFESMEGAANTVIQTIQLGIPVARIEIIDEAQLKVVNAYSKTDYPLAPTLFFEFHGTSEVVGRRSDPRRRRNRPRTRRQRLHSGPRRSRIAIPCGRPGTTRTTRPWRRARARAPGPRTSACRFRISRNASSRLRRICKQANVVAPLVGHAGDGNFHLIIMLDPDDRQEFDTISRISERLVERALKFGGTCSGEHGVGFGKLKYLPAEHGEALDVMRSIKQALDPHNLMNPGKLIPS